MPHPNSKNAARITDKDPLRVVEKAKGLQALYREEPCEKSPLLYSRDGS